MKIANINTNTASRYDLAAIMGRAWAIRRAAAADMGCKVSEVIFSECLKISWAEAEGVNAADNAARLISDWAALGESGQVKIMTACVRKAAKNEIGYSVEDKYLQFDEVPAWGLHGHGFDEFVNETWLRVVGKLDADALTEKNERRAASGLRPLSLVGLVYSAARASIGAIFYADHKHGVASVRTVTDKNGDEYSFIEEMASSRRDNTESAALIRVSLERFRASRDEIDNIILDCLSLGLTERETAPHCHISNVAVHKRIMKLRDALREIVAA